MDAPNPKLTTRRAELLLQLLRGAPQRRLCESQQRFRREEVNSALSEMDDEAITEALHELYRLAEADARHNARVLARAVRKEEQKSWLACLFQRCSWRRAGHSD